MSNPSSVDSQRNLSIFGVGPAFVILSVLYSLIGMSCRYLWPETMTISLIPMSWQTGLGGLLIAVGFPFFIISVRILKRGFPQGSLFTHGPYAACRHPVYAAWVVFLVPGLGLLMHSRPMVLVVLAMYLTLRLLVRKEEEELARLFADEYVRYKKTTPAVFPLLHRMWRSKE